MLAGLGRPVPWVAFEYLPAQPDIAAACVDRLGGARRLRTSTSSPARGRAFALAAWPTPPASARRSPRGRDGRPGDVYARLRMPRC